LIDESVRLFFFLSTLCTRNSKTVDEKKLKGHIITVNRPLNDSGNHHSSKPNDPGQRQVQHQYQDHDFNLQVQDTQVYILQDDDRRERFDFRRIVGGA